ncbi:MAG: efflux RND transporter periplasmic adaptor subunit [Cyclobacteriaceae bacterium]
MRKINYTLTLLTVIALSSILMTGCGSTETTTSDLIAAGDIESIRAKKKELSAKQKELDNEMELLDAVINATDGNRNLPLVTTFTAQTQKFDHYIELQGDVTTKQNVLIYPEVAGILLRVNVKEGEKVKKGQVLATIDDAGVSSQLLQMKTQLALAKTTFERQERLWEQKIGSEIQYLQAKTNYEGQQNAVNQLETQLGKFKITAPFSGIIDDVIKDQGTVVIPGGPGSEVFRIVNLTEMFLEVDVPETYIASITRGKTVKVYFPVLDKTVESKIRQTGNFINPNNRSFTVEVPVPNLNGQIKPNMSAKVLINDYLSEQAILIPQSIISENAEGQQYAFVVSDIDDELVALANKNIITTGKTQGDFVEILSGLNNGDNVIEEGARSVKDGQKVKILSN